MRNLSVVFCILVMVATLPAVAQEILDTQFFPVVARGAGLAGTMWVTDLVLTNPMDEPITMGMQFFPANQDNLFDPTFPVRGTVGPGQTRIAEDVLRELFGYEEDIKGSLILLADPAYLPDNPEGTKIYAVTRTYNVGSAEGTFGQTVPSLVVNANVGWASSFIVGARNDGEFRSNLGIAGTSPISGVRVHYRIRDEDGVVLVEGSKDIRISSMGQWSFEQLGVGVVDNPLTVELWLDPSSMTEDPCETDFPSGFLAYVSKVDNGTGDAEYLSAAAMQPYYCGVVPDE